MRRILRQTVLFLLYVNSVVWCLFVIAFFAAILRGSGRAALGFGLAAVLIVVIDGLVSRHIRE